MWCCKLLLLLATEIFSLSISITNKYPIDIKHNHNWATSFSTANGFSLIDSYLDDYGTLTSIVHYDQRTGSVTNETLPFGLYDYGSTLPFNTKEALLVLQNLEYWEFLRYSRTTPPKLLATTVFPKESYDYCDPTPLASDGVGVWLSCYYPNYSQDHIIYAQANTTGTSFTLVALNAFEKGDYYYWSFGRDWDLESIPAIDTHNNMLYAVASYSDVGLFSFKLSTNPMQFNYTKVPPYPFPDISPYPREAQFIALVQQNKRLLVFFPANSPSNSTLSHVIGVVLLDAVSLNVVAKLFIEGQLYERFGAIRVGDDAVVFWSQASDVKVLFTEFGVLQVVGDSLKTGSGFEVFGAQLTRPSFSADYDASSPQDTILVGLGAEPTAAMYQIKLTKS